MIKIKNNVNELIAFADKQRWELREDFHDLVVESIFLMQIKLQKKVVSKLDDSSQNWVGSFVR